MTDLSSVRALAAQLSLSESTVDTPAVTEALAALKVATLEVDSGDPALAEWLSAEHFSGGVLATAATMNKRGEAAGKGDPFARQPRAVLVERYNQWAARFIDRIDAVDGGRATPEQYLPQLNRFRDDPINNEP